MRPLPRVAFGSIICWLVLLVLSVSCGRPSSSATTVSPSPSSSPISRVPLAAVVTVTRYGAQGDGSTDDAPAFRAAVQAVARAGGGVVLIPAGTYRLVSGIVVEDMLLNVPLPTGVSLQGDGRNDTLLIADGIEGCNALGAVREADIGVYDLGVECRPRRPYGMQKDGIKLEGCEGIVLTRLSLANLYIGVGLYGCRRATIRECVADSCHVSGFSPGDYMESAKQWVGTRDVLIDNCRAVATAGHGFRVFGASQTTRAGGVTLRGCYAERSGENGFLLRWADGCCVVRCIGVRNGGSGFELVGVRGNVLACCRATDNGTIDPYGAGITVAGAFAEYGQSRENVIIGCTSTSRGARRQRFGYREWQAADGNIVAFNNFTGNLEPPAYSPNTLWLANRSR